MTTSSNLLATQDRHSLITSSDDNSISSPPSQKNKSKYAEILWTSSGSFQAVSKKYCSPTSPSQFLRAGTETHHFPKLEKFFLPGAATDPQLLKKPQVWTCPMPSTQHQLFQVWEQPSRNNHHEESTRGYHRGSSMLIDL